MPSVQFVCPHCEKQSEVQVASVTRSRACPHCGYNVLLQVGGKISKSSRRALLVAPAKGEALHVGMEAHVPGTPAYLPKPLEGDAFERMRADPEILAIRKQLFAGLAVLGTLIAGAVVWHFIPAESGPKTAPPPPVAAGRVTPFQPSVTPSANAVSLRGASPRGPSGTLNFTTSSGSVNGTQVPSPMEPEKADQAKKVLAAFMAADTVDVLLTTIANRSSVEAVVRDYYAKHPLMSSRVTEIVHLDDPLAPPGAEAMQVTLSSGRTLEATVLSIDERHLGVDWPSFVVLSDMDWAQFVASKPTHPTQFRLLAELGDWYADAFADSHVLRCLKLVNPNDPTAEPVFAYAGRYSALGQEIDTLLHRRPGPMPLTLRLKFPPGSQAGNQCLIDSVVSGSWVTLPDAGEAAEQVKN
ncbi:MAG: hypothetical protein JWO94_497 [Verrucomicrobiaceae bacterium]|nr:hypothetical protein [Verrucomicrobiaceae bacterium]